MFNVFKLKTKVIYATGDIHGEFNVINYFLKTYDINDSVLFVCGDIGMGFNKKEYYKQIFNKIEKELKKRNSYVLFVRGNHDNPDCFNTEEYNTKHIILLPDYSVVEFYDINIENTIPYNVLIVGGAISIDRKMRIAENLKKEHLYKKYHSNLDNNEYPKCYWENETVIFDEEKLNEIKNSGIKIDTVITHTCPDFCEPYTKDGIKTWLKIDEELEKDVDDERKTMTNIYNKLINDEHPIKNWIYGHYHYHHTSEINGIIFKMLDMARNCRLDFVPIKDFDKN